MRLRPTLPALVAVSLMAATTVFVAPRQALAAPGRTAETALPDGFSSIEVDPATERVFVSSPTSDAVTVLADNGAILSTLTVPGAGDLLIDGSTLYVASTTGGRVDAFDTSTLSFLRSYGEGALLKPNSLAMAGGLLWTTTGPCASDIDLVSIDTATEEILTYPDIPDLYYCPHLFTSPTDPSVLLGMDTGLSPTTVVRLDVSSGAPVFMESLRTDNSNGADGAVLADGKTFALASGWPYEIRTFTVDPLEPHGIVYPTRNYPVAVETTAANGGLLAAANDGTYDRDVDVFRAGHPEARLFTFELGSTENTVYRRALAFSAEGTRLFAVSGAWNGENVRLNVFEITEPRGRYTPLTPARILDTRTGTGGIAGPVGPGSTIDMQVTGRGGVPSTGVTAVAVNVTVTQPTAYGHLTVFPTGQPGPLASNLNFSPGQTIPNLVIVKVGAQGKVSMLNSEGTTHVIADVAGWYSTSVSGNGGRFSSVVPARILDTRTGVGGGVRLGPGASLDLQVAGRGGVPGTGASGVVLNVAATNTTATSYVTVHPSGVPRPLASNLNYNGGDTVSNRTMVKLGAGGRVTIYNSAGSTDVVVDVNGWYTDATATRTAGIYTPLVPVRIHDTRMAEFPFRVVAGGSIDVQVAGRGEVPATGVRAAVLNVTVTQPTAPGHVTVFPAAIPRPLASDVNFAAGETRPNLVVVQLGLGGRVTLYTSSAAHLVVDVAAWIS